MLRTLALATFVPLSALAEPLACASGQVNVDADPPLAERICAVSDQALAEMNACGLSLARPISISLYPDLGSSCVGIYHCGEDAISLLHPDQLAEVISDSTLFNALDVMPYFDSIVVHELAHAAYDEVPCPFNGPCIATSEYLAYALQINSLSADDRAAIGLAEVPETRISRDEINAVFATWVPPKFAVKAWTHLMQRPDPCGYIGSIATGDIFFDFEHP